MTMFSAGVSLTHFYNYGLISSGLNRFGLDLVILFFIGTISLALSRYGLFKYLGEHLWPFCCCKQFLEAHIEFNSGVSSDPSMNKNVYITTLLLNFAIKGFTYSLTSGDGDTKAGKNQTIGIIVNMATVMFISMLHSRIVKLEFVDIKVSGLLLYLCLLSLMLYYHYYNYFSYRIDLKSKEILSVTYHTKFATR